MTLSGLIVLAVFVFRLVFLKISMKNEKAILANGGREYGVQNTKYITILHILFYLSCFAEATIRQVRFDALSAIGFGLLLFSMFMAKSAFSDKFDSSFSNSFSITVSSIASCDFGMNQNGLYS